MKNLPEHIRVKLADNIVSAVKDQAETPVLEHLPCVAILHRIVGSRNTGLEKLADDLRSIESRSPGILAGHDGAGDCIVHSRPYRPLFFSNV